MTGRPIADRELTQSARHPGFELLFLLKLACDRIGLASIGVLAHADAKDSRGTRAWGRDERVISLRRKTTSDTLRFGAFLHSGNLHHIAVARRLGRSDVRSRGDVVMSRCGSGAQPIFGR